MVGHLMLRWTAWRVNVRENHPIGKIISGEVGRQLPKLKVAIPSPKPTVSDYSAQIMEVESIGFSDSGHGAFL